MGRKNYGLKLVTLWLKCSDGYMSCHKRWKGTHSFPAGATGERIKSHVYLLCDAENILITMDNVYISGRGKILQALFTFEKASSAM